MLFEDTIDALARTLAAERAPREIPELSPPHDDAAEFLARELDRLPDYLRFPLRALALVFSAAGLPRGGRLFHNLSHEARARQVARWRASRFGFCRDFVRLADSLATFALCSRLARPSGRD